MTICKDLTQPHSTPQFQGLLNPGNDYYDLVVFCHLRWDFVYQRPQHIINRFAQYDKVLIIEEPLGVDNTGQSLANLLQIESNLHVLQPRTSSVEEIGNILDSYINSRNIPVGWFYSPAFVPLLRHFSFETIVYDCMDELTLFKGAATQLATQEKELISNADLIFTGGKSLYDSKRRLHANVHCFPSSVDQAHFARALDELPLPEDIVGIKEPIAGYFGVIDERIDLELLEATAQLNPDISFVMIGPLAKIGQGDLPRLHNIHYLGMKPYASLPNYIKSFAVAIMPFAINDATKFISPTKTLEYMAAGKPIISTPIKDVVRDFSHCVDIVQSAAEFSAALRLALERRSPTLNADYRKILDNTSWDNTVAKMKSLISAGVAHESL